MKIPRRLLRADRAAEAHYLEPDRLQHEQRALVLIHVAGNGREYLPGESD